jgi:hypothetical protein
MDRRDGFGANIGTGHRNARRETCGTEGYPPLLPPVKFRPPAYPERLRRCYRLQAFYAEAQLFTCWEETIHASRMHLDDPDRKLFHLQPNWGKVAR